MTSRNYAVTYYQTLEKIPWLRGWRKQNDKKFQKNCKFYEKIAKICDKKLKTTSR